MAARSFAAMTAARPRVRVVFPPSLLVGLAVATSATGLLAVAPALPVAAAGDGASTHPSFTAGPLLAVLAFAGPGLAWALAARGRAAAATGVLAGAAALAPGRAVLDLQLIVAPWRAARPELLVATSLAPLKPGPGAWVLLLGHLLTGAAGVLAVQAVRRGVIAPEPPLPGSAARPASRTLPASNRVTSRATKRRAPSRAPDGRAAGAAGQAGAGLGEVGEPRAGAPGLTAALCAGVVAALGLMLAPFRSSDPYLLPEAVPDAPLPAMAGVLLLAGGVMIAAGLAASAADHGAGRGGLWGVAMGVTAAALPPMAAALFAPDVGGTWGPRVALAGAAGLVGTAWLVGREPRAAAGDELSLPALDRLHGVAGALALASALFALVGAVASQVHVPEGAEQPVFYPARLLVPAGLLLAALGGVLVAGSVSARYARAAALARPALAVAWAAMALAGTAVLDAALTAVQIPGVRAGLGVWAAGLALLAALAAGCAAAVAGGVERDEVDLSQVHAARPPIAAGVSAAVLALPAFGLPLLTAPDYAPAGLWSNFQVGSWGLVAALAAVVTAALLAPSSRPSRAVGLLLGALAVVALRLAELPLTGERAGPAAGTSAGTWFSLACALALLTGAVLAWRRREPGRDAAQYAQPSGAASRRRP